MQLLLKPIGTLFVGFAVAFLCACSNGAAELGPDQDIPAPPAPPEDVIVLKISALTVSPAIVLPGQSAILSVSATAADSANISYAWYASEGTLGATSTNTVTWTAPTTEGSHRVVVDVADGTTAVRGYVNVLVAVSAPSTVVTSVIPAEVKAGDTVRIVGRGFRSTQGSSLVSIGGVAAESVESWSDSEIRAIVPTDAKSGDVTVTVNAVGSNPGRIIVLWPNESPDNSAVPGGTGEQESPVLTTDGAGGAYVVWVDYRAGEADIYAQRVDSRGTVLWNSDGVPVTTATSAQIRPRVIADGSGGAIVVWEDYRSGTDYNIYAQKLNAYGTVAWAADGVAIVTAAQHQLAPRLVSDDAEGAIVAWQDFRSDTDYDIYAQKLNADGSVAWAADGVAVASAPKNQLSVALTGDGAGGAILVWEDYRSDTNYDVYAQRLDGLGAIQWAADGVVVTNGPNNELSPAVLTDGEGGVFLAWQDYRGGANYDIYAQRINGFGVPLWPAAGVSVSDDTDSQVSPQLVPAGSTGVIVVWEDYRNGNADIYAQRLSSNGAAQWTQNGAVVIAESGNQLAGQAVTDNADGVIVVWEDHRAAPGLDIYAQRIGSSGAPVWTAEGIVVTGADNDQRAPNAIADGQDGVIVAWEDRRGGSVAIYAQGVSASGRQ
jgi:hypothetical protein